MMSAGEHDQWKVNGAAIKATLDFIRAQHGEEGLADVLERLSDENRTRLSRAVLLSSWYPGSLFVELTAMADHALGYMGGFADAIGIASAEYALGEGGPYHIFLEQGQRKGIEAFLASTTKLWSLYYDTGTWVIAESDASSVRIHVDDAGAFPDAVVARICSFVGRSLELIGAGSVRVIPRVAGDRLVIQARWS